LSEPYPSKGAPRRSPRVRLAGALVAFGLAWLVGYPLLVTLGEAFGLPRLFTMAHFAEFARRADEWQALWRSLWISAASVGLAALVGTPLAFLVERSDFPGRRVLGALLALPVALPPLIGVIAFLFLYGESGVLGRLLRSAGADVRWQLGGPWAILLVHAYSMYVYFYVFVRTALQRLDASLYEAAASLGASRARTLRRVTLPLLRPALAGAALLTFMTALASFSAPYIFGGGFRVMTTQIVASKLNGELEMAYVETVMLAFVALGGLALLRRVDSGAGAAAGGRGVAPARARSVRWLWRALLGLATLAATLVLLLPHATLVLLSLAPPNTWTVEALPPVLALDNYRTLLESPERLRPVLNSLWMAAAATLGALLLGLLAARLSVRLRGRLGRLLEWELALPWAIPGTVFAVALATTWSVDQPATLRFVLVGTPVILPLAYLLRSLPVTGRSALAGLRQLDPALEEASASLGASGARTLRRVVLPLLRPALLAAGALAFITALGDFVTSIVLYTFETRPIAIEVLSSLRMQETGLAAVYGVLLMAVSAVAFLLWGGRSSL
jgi:iron(III) transport system permease protein